MKKVILSFLLATALFSYDLAQFYKDYQDKNYLKACKKGVNIFNRYKQDENYLTVYSFACLKSDMIDRLAVPVTGLRLSKEARANASYFSAILLQKKILYHAVIDDVDISSLKLPTTNFVLSRVFDMYINKEYVLKDETYLFEDLQKGLEYKMYVVQTQRFQKLIIEQYKDTQLINSHEYF